MPEVKVTVTKMMYGWSKWGGATHGLAKETLDEWYCQLCAEKQTKGVPGYMIALDDTQRDFARVCSKCKSKSVRTKIKDYFRLISLVGRNFDI